MKSYRDYWTFSAIRGFITLALATGMVVLPLLAVGIIGMPMSLGLAINVFIAYLLLDCIATILLAIMFPTPGRVKTMLLLQIAGEFTVAAALYTATLLQVNPHYLLALAAGQALVCAVTEFTIAQETHKQYRCLSCYATVFFLTVAALGLPLLGALDATNAALGLATFTAAFGLTQISVGGRMLFTEYRANHPAQSMQQAWGNRMILSEEPACGACASCPALSECNDFSLPGQLRRVAASRVPSIVKGARTVGLIELAQT
jgi:hypothetical protein